MRVSHVRDWATRHLISREQTEDVILDPLVVTEQDLNLRSAKDDLRLRIGRRRLAIRRARVAVGALDRTVGDAVLELSLLDEGDDLGAKLMIDVELAR